MLRMNERSETQERYPGLPEGADRTRNDSCTLFVVFACRRILGLKHQLSVLKILKYCQRMVKTHVFATSITVRRLTA